MTAATAEKSTSTPADDALPAEMERYRITSFADIVRALKAHPDWLEQLRELILTTELIELPRKFEELLRRVEKIEADVEVLKQDVEIIKQDVAILKQDMAYLKGEFGRFKGSDFERRVRERFAAYFGAILKRGRLVSQEQLMALVDDAEEAGRLSAEERQQAFLIDALVEGQIRRSNKPVVLAIEVSVTAYPEDLERASRRAAVLAKVFGKEVIPTVVAAQAEASLEATAQEAGILLILKDLD
ncbi:MAG: hypothetical protein N3C63_11925 [Rhodocyclaceae bacterium]|nr:hypothetical protein [Rhodocyclaceae bacterium]